MHLSNDLIIFDDIGSADCIGIYNAFAHTFSIAHREIYKYLLKSSKEEGFTNIYDDLSEEQIDIFISNGVLVNNVEQYSLLKRHFDAGSRQRQIKAVYLHTTLECNLACEYCYNADSLVAKCPSLTLEQWTQALDRLHSVGLQNINLTGGEPLLYPEILGIVTYAKSLGIHVTLLTNGTLAKTNIEIFDLIDNCIVSLDTVSSSKRKGIEDYDVLQNIFDVASRHPSKIKVRSVIVRGLEKEVEDLTNVLKTHNIEHDKVLFMPCHENDFELIPDYDEYNLYDYELGAVTRCGAGDTILALDPMGNIFPCQLMMKPEFCMGNIFDSDWIDRYKNNAINDVMASYNAKAHKLCDGCNARQLCNGGCRAAAYRVYGDLEYINEFFCDFQKKSASETIKRIFNREIEREVV